MRILIVAPTGDALERARKLETRGVDVHRVASLAQARAALHVEPRIEAILIDAASEIARSRHVVAARWPAPALSDACAAMIDDAGAKGFVALPAEPGLVEAIDRRP